MSFRFRVGRQDIGPHGRSRTPTERLVMTDLIDLPNIGPRLASALTRAGISGPEELRVIGSLEAWWRIHPTFDCMHSLYALEGAVRGIPKLDLDRATREQLKKATQLV